MGSSPGPQVNRGPRLTMNYTKTRTVLHASSLTARAHPAAPSVRPRQAQPPRRQSRPRSALPSAPARQPPAAAQLHELLPHPLLRRLAFPLRVSKRELADSSKPRLHPAPHRPRELGPFATLASFASCQVPKKHGNSSEPQWIIHVVLCTRHHSNWLRSALFRWFDLLRSPPHTLPPALNQPLPPAPPG